MPMDAAESGETNARRTFLAQVIGACVAFLATLVGIPAIGAAVLPALRTDESTWLPLGDPESFQNGIPKLVSVSATRSDGWIQTIDVHAIWVIRESATQFTAYNGRCTHLGCAYNWQSDQRHFACPCHAGMFSLSGQVLAGPPPRPLDSLSVRIEGGLLQAQYQDFQLGTANQVVV